jgi:single-strand DNA-binding protein
MNNLNSIILEGNLVRDAQLTEPAPGFKKCAFSIAVNRFFKNRKNEDVNEASFFEVEAYGKMAEYCGEKAKKGRGVRVVGRLKQDTWKDENGKSASKVYVVAEHIEYKPMKKVEAEEAAKTQDATSPEKTEAQAEPQTEAQPVPVETEAVF